MLENNVRCHLLYAKLVAKHVACIILQSLHPAEEDAVSVLQTRAQRLRKAC